MMIKKDRRGSATALRAAGLSENDPRFVEIWQRVFGKAAPPPSPARGRKP
jgi:hypothetical protein